MRRILNFLILSIVLVVLAVVFLQVYITRHSEPFISDDVAGLDTTYTGIVLGASVRPDKSLSPILRDRVDTAYEAFTAGKITRFLLSGDHGERNYDEVNAMKSYLNLKGVPDEVIFLDHAGFDTYDSMIRARDVFEIENAIVFTQEFHLPRAIYIGRKLGLNITGCISDKQEYQAISRFKRREWLANIKAWIEINIDKEPTYTGAVIPITGDSSLSHDKK